MDRRDSLKSLLVGSVAGGLALNGCSPADQKEEVAVEAPADMAEHLRKRSMMKNCELSSSSKNLSWRPLPFFAT